MRSTATAPALLLVAALVAACGGSATATPPSTVPATAAVASAATPATVPATNGAASPALSLSPSPNTSGLPDFDHVYVIVMENREYGQIVGQGTAPYLNSLVAKYGLATDFYGVTHPSQPNYIALTSGGLQGTTSDGTYNLSVPNLFDQVEASGRTWRVYEQDYPGGCFKGGERSGGVDGPGSAGEYARKHNPAISYTSISSDPARCAHITGLAGFDPAAADFEFIAPNQTNDMHSSWTSSGDAFLAAFVPAITGSPAFVNSVLFITWDEGTSSAHGGGHIATIVVSPGMTPGARFTATANHYSILRTIELAWGLPLLGEAANAPTLVFPW
jgi:phosphatidylinositol-3-phosphatase